MAKKESCHVCRGAEEIITELVSGGFERHKCVVCNGTGTAPKPSPICSRCHSPLKISFGYEEITLTCPRCGDIN